MQPAPGGYTEVVGTMNGLLGAVRDPLFYLDMLENARQVGGGLLSGAIGAPVDVATMFMRPLGYGTPDKKVAGSSENIGGLLGLNTDSVPYRVGSLLPTDSGDLIKYGGLLGAAMKKAKPISPIEGEAIARIKTWVGLGRPQTNWHDGGAEARAAVDAIHRWEDSRATPGVFWRGTNDPAEVGRVSSVVSRNHSTGQSEAGLSVSRAPSTIMMGGYKHGYRVTGDIVGIGSDGEPVLSHVKALDKRALSRAQVSKHGEQWRASEKAALERLSKATGLTQDEIRWLSMR